MKKISYEEFKNSPRLFKISSKEIKSDYKKYEIQPSLFINKNKILFAEGNAIKYICRHQDKGKKQDLLKAIHYIQMIIERDYDQ